MKVVVTTLPAPAYREDLDTSTYKKVYVEFWRMRGKKYNPQRRVERGRTKFKDLMESIRTYGIVDPPVLTSDYEKIDGHRRTEAGAELGLAGCICLIAPFDSDDPRSDELYKILNTIEVMPGRQQWEVMAKGGPELTRGLKTKWAKVTAILGDDPKSAPYLKMFADRGYVPQYWNNAQSTSDLWFNNGLVKDKGAREGLTIRRIMQWECAENGEGRQSSLKRYLSAIKAGKPGFTAKKLKAAIENDENISA